MAHELRGAAAVVGVGLTPFGEIPGHNHMEIMAGAVHNAMTEAGVTRDQIDGIFGSNFLDIFTPLTVAEYFGFRPRFMDGTNIGVVIRQCTPVRRRRPETRSVRSSAHRIWKQCAHHDPPRSSRRYGQCGECI